MEWPALSEVAEHFASKMRDRVGLWEFKGCSIYILLVEVGVVVRRLCQVHPKSIYSMHVI